MLRKAILICLAVWSLVTLGVINCIIFVPQKTTVYVVVQTSQDGDVKALMNKLKGTNLKKKSASFLQYCGEGTKPVAVSRHNYTFDVKLSLYGQWRAKKDNCGLLFAFMNEKPRYATHYEAFYVEQETARTPVPKGELKLCIK